MIRLESRLTAKIKAMEIKEAKKRKELEEKLKRLEESIRNQRERYVYVYVYVCELLL